MVLSALSFFIDSDEFDLSYIYRLFYSPSSLNVCVIHLENSVASSVRVGRYCRRKAFVPNLLQCENQICGMVTRKEITIFSKCSILMISDQLQVGSMTVHKVYHHYQHCRRFIHEPCFAWNGNNKLGVT